MARQLCFLLTELSPVRVIGSISLPLLRIFWTGPRPSEKLLGPLDKRIGGRRIERQQ
jgi:hypothetical protein